MTNRLEQIDARIDEIYENATIELRSSYISNFDCDGERVTFERLDNETGDTLKTYEVYDFEYDEPTVEWNTDNDGGYGCWSRLNREVKALCRELIALCKEKDELEENELFSDEETAVTFDDVKKYVYFPVEMTEEEEKEEFDAFCANDSYAVTTYGSYRVEKRGFTAFREFEHHDKIEGVDNISAYIKDAFENDGATVIVVYTKCGGCMRFEKWWGEQ